LILFKNKKYFQTQCPIRLRGDFLYFIFKLCYKIMDEQLLLGSSGLFL